MYKRSKIIFSMILVVAMLIGIIPFSASAHNSQLTSNAASDSRSTEEIIEVEELREENVKHFQMPDGSYRAVVYNAPVHRRDMQGEWQNIDNHFFERTQNNKQTYVTADGRSEFSEKLIKTIPSFLNCLNMDT